MGHDLRFAFRTLLKSPGFTLMAVVALALAIGANPAIFSVVNSVLLERMPFERPDRLAILWEQSPQTRKANVVNPINFLEWQARNHSFERIAANVEYDVSLTGDGEPEVVDAVSVSDGFFDMLGVKPVLGRWFTSKEDTPGNDNVVMISESLWRRRYGADPGVLGRKLLFSNTSVVIVGVMPASFRFPQTRAEIWSPLAIDRARALRSGRYLNVVGRLRNGATLASAQADMNVIAALLQKERPDFNSKWGITVVGLREQATGDVRTPLLVLLGAVGLVLLIACANVANLLLMRAAGRSRELAVRSALGAGAVRIVRQLLIESTLLACLGGAVGLLVGLWAIRILTAALPDTIAYANLKTIRLDAVVFLFTLGVSLATGILFGIAPALKAVRIDVQSALKDGGRGIAGGRSFTRGALVIAEIALSMILLVGAGLLIRSFSRLAAVDPGFDARHVLSMRLVEEGRFRANNAGMIAFNLRMLERVRAVPGVEAAGTSHFIPLGRMIPGTWFWRLDHPPPHHGEEPVTDVLCVLPGYFAAMNIPLERGRVFTEADRAGAPYRVVINQTLARDFFPSEDPIGKSLHVDWTQPAYEIIGVVGDVHQHSMGDVPKDEVFLPMLQNPTGPVYLVARTHGDPKLLASAIQAQIHSLDRDLPISYVKTMDEYVSGATAAPRFNTILLGGFAALALLLAAVGIFGVISYSVAQRTQEIGIRRALGANTSSVMQLVLAQALGLTAAGVAVGVGGAYALTRLMSTLLYGVTPTDVPTFAAVAATLSAVALLASYLPARKAAKVDPMVALRYE
jgi:putative ABC transport system permease protein